MSQRFRTIIFCLLLFMISVIVFGEVKSHQFVYDDLGLIVRNDMVKGGLTWNGLSWAFSTSLMGIWHPLTWLSHMVDCQIFGVNPGGPHLINLLFHIINTLLLFLLLSSCTGRDYPSFLAAALFAVHPLHVESVAWAAERKDLLSTLFWMLTMWIYVRYARNPGWQLYLLMLLCFCLGLMAKPMLVTLPVILLLWDYWPLRRWAPFAGEGAGESAIIPGGNCSCQRTPLGWLLLEKAPLLVPVVLISLITISSQKAAGALVSLTAKPLTVRISNALLAYATYLGKTVLPINLVVFYPYPGQGIPGWQVLGSALGLAGLSFLIIRRARNYPYLLVGWLWFLITLLPVIGLVQVGEQALADRYTYIPLVGLFIAAAWGLADLLERFRSPRVLLLWVTAGLILVLGTRAWFQVHYWRDAVALFEHNLSVAPESALVHGALGEALFFRGEQDRALGHFQKAISLSPIYGLNGLAWVLATTSDPRFRNGAEALRSAQLANQLTNYSSPDVLDTLGAAYAEVGKFAEAEATARRALLLARAAGKADLARDIAKRLALYQQGQAYRDEAYATFQR